MTTPTTQRMSFGALGLVGAVLACANPHANGRAARPAFDPDVCAAIPDDKRRSSPLEAPYTIDNVAPVYRHQWIGRGAQRHPIQGTGKMTEIRVTLRTPSRTTLDELDVRLQCHIAWMRSSDGDSPAVRSCPLAVPGTSTEVRMGYGDHFTIAIMSKDHRATEEAWRRVRAMTGAAAGTFDDAEERD